MSTKGFLILGNNPWFGLCFTVPLALPDSGLQDSVFERRRRSEQIILSKDRSSSPGQIGNTHLSCYVSDDRYQTYKKVRSNAQQNWLLGQIDEAFRSRFIRQKTSSHHRCLAAKADLPYSISPDFQYIQHWPLTSRTLTTDPNRFGWDAVLSALHGCEDEYFFWHNFSPPKVLHLGFYTHSPTPWSDTRMKNTIYTNINSGTFVLASWLLSPLLIANSDIAVICTFAQLNELHWLMEMTSRSIHLPR